MTTIITAICLSWLAGSVLASICIADSDRVPLCCIADLFKRCLQITCMTFALLWMVPSHAASIRLATCKLLTGIQVSHACSLFTTPNYGHLLLRRAL